MKLIVNILLGIALIGGVIGLAGFQQPQAPNGTPPFNVDATTANGVAPGYYPKIGTGLVLNLGPGTAYCSTGNIVTYAGGTLTLTANMTNYVYLNVGSSCVPAFNTSGFTAGEIPIATVVVGASTITSIQDDRTMFTNPTASGSTISLTITGTSGAATLIGTTLNIPQYQGAITLTTIGSSGAATFSGGTLNIPNYTFSNGISGLTSGQVAIAGSSSTLTSSKALAGSGAGITTGPTSSTNNDCASFNGTTGQIQDAGSPCGSGGGGDTITSPNSTLAVGGTSSNTTLDVAPVNTVVDTSGTVTVSTTKPSEFHFNENATAATAITYNLPTASAGKQFCFANAYNGSAPNTGALQLQTSASGQFIIFTDGTLSATGGYVISGGAAADGACLVGVDSTHWYLYVQSGTWTKH